LNYLFIFAKITSYFVFFLHIILNKSSFVVIIRLIEACRTCRALDYTRSVVLFKKQSEFALKNNYIFLLCFMRK